MGKSKDYAKFYKVVLDVIEIDAETGEETSIGIPLKNNGEVFKAHTQVFEEIECYDDALWLVERMWAGIDHDYDIAREGGQNAKAKIK